MLKLKLQCFGQLMQRADSLEKTLMLGKIEDRRRRGWQRMRWLDGITNSTDMNLSKLWQIVKNRESWHAAVHWGYKELDTSYRVNNNNICHSFLMWDIPGERKGMSLRLITLLWMEKESHFQRRTRRLWGETSLARCWYFLNHQLDSEILENKAKYCGDSGCLHTLSSLQVGFLICISKTASLTKVRLNWLDRGVLCIWLQANGNLITITSHPANFVAR